NTQGTKNCVATKRTNGLLFTRPELTESVLTLVKTGDAEDRSIGRNYLMEENVSDQRLSDVETYNPASMHVREVVDNYFKVSVQGPDRGHLPSTFDKNMNSLALLSDSVEPIQKIVRLERIDGLLQKGGISFTVLEKALQDRQSSSLTGLTGLTDLFLDYPGERPSFATFRSELVEDLKTTDWLQRLIDRLGLYHHYPFNKTDTYRFALMEYTASEVIQQAHTKKIEQCFAVPTVLECQNNPAFFPVPRSTPHGFAVDLRERNPQRSTVREILHTRFDYSWTHVKRLAEWTGADLPDIEAARKRHLEALRQETGCRDFGDVEIRE
uniref:hypothetical protein n=1 Tax=Acetobacter aceti TaxID=435 RepID=UPI0015E10687